MKRKTYWYSKEMEDDEPDLVRTKNGHKFTVVMYLKDNEPNVYPTDLWTDVVFCFEERC